VIEEDGDARGSGGPYLLGKSLDIIRGRLCLAEHEGTANGLRGGAGPEVVLPWVLVAGAMSLIDADGIGSAAHGEQPPDALVRSASGTHAAMSAF
jgi:hypothetical protein